MNREFVDFANEVRDHIFEDAGDRDNLKIELHPMQSVNQQEQLSLSVRQEGSSIAPSVRLRPIFDAYKEGESMENIIRSIEKTILENIPRKDMDLSYFANFDNVKDQILPKLVNREMNSEMLKTRPHYDIGDLSVMFYVKIDQAFIHDGQITVTDEIMKGWGVNETAMMDASLDNIKRDTVCMDLLGLMKELVPDLELGIDADIPGEHEPVVITTGDKLFGAATILNKEAMKTLCERMGCEVIILPSSIHECLLLPYEGSPEQEIALKNMVRDVNDSAVSREDLLSYNIYHFDGENLSVIDTEKSRNALETGTRLENGNREKAELVNARTGRSYASEKSDKEQHKMMTSLHQKEAGKIADGPGHRRDELAM